MLLSAYYLITVISLCLKLRAAETAGGSFAYNEGPSAPPQQ